MKRRDVVLGGGAVLLSAALSRAEDPHADHAAHAVMAGPGAALLTAALACEGMGEQCIAHCFQVIEAGDVSIAGCARAYEACFTGGGFQPPFRTEGFGQ